MAENKEMNTSENIGKPKANDSELNRQVKEAGNKMKKEKLVTVSVNKAFVKNVGPYLPVSINGARIVLPVDGTKHKVPEPYGVVLEEYLENLTT